MKTIIVAVKVQIEDDCDPQDVISECDYSFDGDGIIDTEIVGVFDSNETVHI